MISPHTIHIPELFIAVPLVFDETRRAVLGLNLIKALVQKFFDQVFGLV